MRRPEDNRKTNMKVPETLFRRLEYTQCQGAQ